MSAWYDLPADPVLRAAFYLACGLALVTVLIMVQVQVLSQLAVRRQRDRKAFTATWRPILALASLSGQPGEVPAAPTGSQELWFLMLWNRTQRQLRGDARNRLNQFAVQLGIDRCAIELVRGRGVRRQLVGLATLRSLADEAHWDTIVALVEHANPFLSLAAAEALVAAAPARAMQRILPIAATRRDWAILRLATVCRRAGREAVTQALLPLLPQAADATSRLFAIIDWAEPARVAPWARDNLGDERPIVQRTSATRVLGELGDPRDRSLLQALLSDPHPDLRLAALRAMRRHFSSDDAGLLQPLLADPSWWVRQEAADALVALPGTSRQSLESLARALDDRYGRDALVRALAERPA